MRNQNKNILMITNVPEIKLFGIPVAAISMAETISVVKQAINTNKQLHHSVVNAGKIVLMQKNEELRESVINADLINADGMAVVWASKLLRKPLPERVTGIDLMINLVQMAHSEGKTCYFLGAEEEVVSKVVDIYTDKYSSKVIAGYHNGYFDKEEGAEIAEKIADSGAHMLFVAITSPKKEIFLDTHKKALQNVNLIMGVGGSFDVVAGKVERAPLWMQKTGLEWFYRFIQEPRRMAKRYIKGNFAFMKLTIREMFSKKDVVMRTS